MEVGEASGIKAAVMDWEFIKDSISSLLPEELYYREQDALGKKISRQGQECIKNMT
jgi:hypothetical protein